MNNDQIQLLSELRDYIEMIRTSLKCEKNISISKNTIENFLTFILTIIQKIN